MSDSDTNAAVVAKMLDDWLAGDMESVAGAYHPDAVWHLPGSSVISGDHVGWDAILGFFGRTFELTEGTMNLDVLDVCAGQSYVVQWQRATASRGDASLDLLEAIVHRMENGLIVETFHRTEVDELEAFFGTA